MQDYPKGKVETVIIDGGSKDETLEIARQFTKRILKNPLRTGEAGKAVGLSVSRHELVAFVDSDNILVGTNWLKRMTAPFTDDSISVAEPYAFTHRPSDPLITRYVALYGVCDPLQLYVTNRDRWNWERQNWTDAVVHSVVDRGDYYLVELEKNVKIPTIGANGFMGRRELLMKANCKPYYFDVDVVFQLAQMGFNRVAMVKTGMVHLHANSLRMFIRKTFRRIRDYYYFERERKYPWKIARKGIIKFAFYTMLILPLMVQSIKGYKAKPDHAWFFHPLASLFVLLTYGIVYIFLRPVISGK